MTVTNPPATRPENPGVKAPGEDPRSEPIDKIAPPAPGVGRPSDAPVDPNRSPDDLPPVDVTKKGPGMISGVEHATT
jgi:hypothetical protein